jgi:hypothetical protein
VSGAPLATLARMLLRTTVFTLATTIALGSLAHADEHADKAAQGRAAAEADLRLAAHADTGPEVTWYGWQVLPVDVATLAIGLQSRDLGVLVGAYSLGAPLVHWAHGHRTRAIIDFGVRAAVPLSVGLFAGERCESSDHDGLAFTCDDERTMAALLPALGISLVDMVLSRDERAPAQHATGGFGLGAAPRAEGGFQLSFGGSF